MATQQDRDYMMLQGRLERLRNPDAGQKIIDTVTAANTAARESRQNRERLARLSASAYRKQEAAHQKIRRTVDHGNELIDNLDRATTNLKQTLPSGGGRIKDVKKNYTAAMEAAKNFTIFHQQTHPTALRAEQRMSGFAPNLDHNTLHMVLDPAKNQRANQALGNFISAQEEAESLKYTSKKQGRPNKLKTIVKKPSDHSAITGWIKSQHIPTVEAGETVVRAPIIHTPSKQGGRKTRKHKRRHKRKTRKHGKKKRTRRRKPKKKHRRTRRR